MKLLILSVFILSNIILGEITTVVATGYGISHRTAITNAKRNAIEKSIGMLISAKSIVNNHQLLNSRILSRSTGYIKDYKIVEKRKENRQFIITIKTEVTELYDDIINDKNLFQFFLAESGFPYFTVIIKDEKGRRIEKIENRIKKALALYGFKFKYHKKGAGNRELVESDILYLLNGTIKDSYKSEKTPFNLNVKKLNLELVSNVINLQNMEVIDSGDFSSSSLSGNRTKAMDSALDKLTKKLAPEIFKGIMSDFHEREKSGLNRISITFNNLKGNEAGIITNMLHMKFGGTESVHPGDYENGRYKIILNTYMSSSNISSILLKDKFEEFGFMLKTKKRYEITLDRK